MTKDELIEAVMRWYESENAMLISDGEDVFPSLMSAAEADKALFEAIQAYRLDVKA